MRAILFTILFFSLIWQEAFAQDSKGLITYEMHSKDLSLNEDMPNLLKNIVGDFNDDKNLIIITVALDEKMSVSRYDEAFFLANNHEFSWAQIIADDNPYTCNNLIEKSISYSSELDSVIYQVEQFYDISEYVLVDEQKTINGHNCKKAVKWFTPPSKPKKIIETIWYSTELTLPIGPLRFAGFPGTVLEVDALFHKIKVVDLIYKEVPEVYCELNGLVITSKGFEELRESSFKSKFTFGK